MSCENGREYYCAYRGVYVARSEYNSKGAFYHESENGTPYMGSYNGECKCITCDVKDKKLCETCNQPSLLKAEQRAKEIQNIGVNGYVTDRVSDLISRCTRCVSQYKVNGKLR